ncbi:hypothetical protein FA592_11935 [Sulfurospirillum diekertiae]|uniref:Calx-beta domain-containing protein n=1 Tax=Sulfurospirillum diekertiae TaxID=1854492 RepID=UPI0014276F39|nr:Calx-beta domain-containing protein [Sulfurospirillum diekertiae]QIR79523.1 hypothetical protein FA592_11935 [Sulfurospirillum diekertiae]
MKKNSLFLFIFLIIFFHVISWGACTGPLQGTWNTTATTYSHSNNSFTADYYTINVSQPGTLNLTINNTSSGSGTRSLTASLFPTGTCSSTATWTSGTVTKGNSTTGNIAVSAGTYTLQLTRSNSSTTGYSLNGTFSLPTLSIADASLAEGNSGTSYMNFTVTLSPSANASVNYTTANGTATAGSDYITTSGTLTFTSVGTTTQTISVPILGDTVIEPDETFTVTLSNASGATISRTTATGTILNDDNPTVTIGEREFAIRNPVTTRNIKGGLQVIGNTVLCVQNNGVCYDYTGNLTNSDLNLQYIDVDGITRNYNNSSQAQLNIPTTATIKWAGIYSQGYLNTYNSTSVTTILKDPIYVTIPNMGTISSIPEVIDLYANGTYGYTYDTFAALPSLIGQTGATVNGWITGANIKANTGTDSSGLGNFGAWVLVVVYEDSNSSLKNISVYDGYKRVANAYGFNTVNITPTGFLTPTSGSINSTLSLFVGEGDKNIAGDKLYVNSTAINDTNAFYSTMSGFNANPNYSNTEGIDIQNHNIGVDGNTSHPQIIGNGTTSATITLTSTQDTYFPSVVAFTTELYEPRVCYVEAYYNADGNATLTSAKVGDIITIKTWIANMKKDASDGNLETAQKVQITMEHDDTNLAYKPESTQIQNVGESAYTSKTDANDSDIATFYSDTNTSVWNIGTGANGTNGGDLTPNVTNDPNNKAYISFKEKLQTSGDITIANVYKVSYENSSMGLRIGDESPVNIGVCKDFNSLITVSAPLGVFNVVNQNFSGSTNSKDGTTSDNALYTQIAGQDFNVKLLVLNTDYTTLKSYTGDVNLSLISEPNYLVADTDAQKQAKCDAASPLTTAQTISFTSESSKTLSLNYSTAYKNVAFKVAYNDSGTTKYVCSRDSFAIRPATYVMTTNAAHLVGGANYTLTVNAVTNNTAVNGYTQAITTNTTSLKALLDLIIPAGCNLPAAQNALNPMTFTNGIATYGTFTYNNVGDVNVTVSDNNWTTIDQNSNSDCLAESTASEPDGNGKVGCLIEKVQQFTFSPKQFNNQLALKNFNDGNFTYISNDNNMSAKALLTTTAVLNDAITTATNYTAKCYARNIDYTLALINNKNLSTSTTQNRIHYFDDTNATSHLENNATLAQATFSSTEGNFTNGTASNLTSLFNFTRTITTADEPFKIAKNDFNITNVIDSNGTSGIDFNRTIDQNTTFYYGRVYSTDYRGPTNIDTTIRYEIYCKNCIKTDFNIIGVQSPTSLTWYQNPLHVNNDGNVTKFSSVGTTLINNLDETASGAIANGIETNTLKNAVAPYTDRIQMTPSSWLLYNSSNTAATTNDFNVEFIRSGDWAGQGNLGKTVDVNSSVRTNRRMEW